MAKVGGILEVRPPKIKWQPGEASASELYQEWPLDPTLTHAVCLNCPSFPTILLNLRYRLFTELHPNSRHQLCPPSTFGY